MTAAAFTRKQTAQLIVAQSGPFWTRSKRAQHFQSRCPGRLVTNGAWHRALSPRIVCARKYKAGKRTMGPLYIRPAQVILKT